jgi:hypothetical protein
MKIFPSALFSEAVDAVNGGGGTLLNRGAGAVDGGGNPGAGSAGNGEGDASGKASSFDLRSYLDDKGNFKQGWGDSLPDDLKASAGSLTKYPNPLELLRGHANASKLIGQKTALKAPAPDAKPEEKAKFNEQIRGILGIPANVADYKLTKPDNLPDGIHWSDGDAAEFAKLAYELNIPLSAAQKLVEFDLQRAGKSMTAAHAKLDEFVKGQEAELRKDWGADFDGNLGKAMKAAQLMGFDINDSELGNNAKFIKAMHTASNLISNDKLVGSDKSGTVMDGAAQAEDIRRNPNNPWHAAYMGKEGPARQQEAADLMARLQGAKK